MLYIISQKFWEKKCKKLVAYNDYLGIDGENYAITGRPSDETAICTKYSNMVSVGNFTPDMKLYTMLRKLKKNEPIDERKFRREVDYYIDDIGFIACVIKAIKALTSYGVESPINVFLILPNVVYKYMEKIIEMGINNYAKMDFEFVYNENDLKEDRDILERKLNKTQLKAIKKRCKALEKEHGIRYSDPYDE